MLEAQARTRNRDSQRLAAIDQLLLAGIKLGPASGTLQVNHQKSRKFRLWRELEAEACMS